MKPKAAKQTKTTGIPYASATTGTPNPTRNVPAQLAVRATDWAAPTLLAPILWIATIHGSGPKPMENEATNSKVAAADRMAHPNTMLKAKVAEKIDIETIDANSKTL